MFTQKSFCIGVITWIGFASAHAAIDIYPIGDTISCTYFILPPIAGFELSGNESYYLSPSGIGPIYRQGDTLFTSTVVYAFDFEGNDADEECFYVQIVSNLPDLDIIKDDTVCQYYLLPYFTTPAVSGFAGYYTGTMANGIRFQQGDTLWYSADLFVYDGYPGCYVEKEISITIDTLPVFDSIPPQYGCHEYELIPFNGQEVILDQVFFTSGSSVYHPGDILFKSQTLTANAPNGVCTAQKDFELNVVDHLELDMVADTIICGHSFHLPSITGPIVTPGASYFTMTNGKGEQFVVDAPLSASQHPIIYLYDSIPGSNCVDEVIWQLDYTPRSQAWREFTVTVCRGFSYSIDTLLLRRNIEKRNNTIIPTADNPIVPGISVFNTGLYPAGAFTFYIIDDSGYPCIPDTAIMTVITTDNCTNPDFTEIYCTYHQDLLLHLTVNLESDPAFCLGGRFVQLSGEPFKNWNDRVYLDRSTPDTVTYYYILSNPSGSSDTALVTIQIQDVIPITSKLIGPDTLCKGECTPVQIVFLDDDEYVPIWLVESVDSALAFQWLMFNEQFSRSDSIWYCFQNGEKNITQENQDTIFLPVGNHTYTTYPWFIMSLKECQQPADSLIYITTLEENTFFFEETHCAGSKVMLFGELFSESRPEGEIRLNEPAANGCDSFIYVRLSFYKPAVARYEQTLCYDDTVIINCIAYSRNFPTDTQYLPGLGVFGCDSVIIVSLIFSPIANFFLDTSLCEGEVFEFAGLSFDAAGVSTGTIAGTNLCDSLFYTIQIEIVPVSLSTITIENPICPETPGMLSIYGNYQSLLWSTGDTTAKVEIVNPGLYMVTITDVNGCTQIVAATLGDADEFFITGVHHYTGMPEQPILFDLHAVGDMDSIVWTPGNGLDCTTCLNPMATLTSSQVYDYYAMDINGCTVTGSVTAHIEIDEKTFVPNIFYPLSDIPDNRVFSVFTSPASKAYSLSIFDRWGNAMFHQEDLKSNDSGSSWNGKTNGRLVQSGVYAYRIVFEGSTKPVTGTVTIIY